MSAGNYERMTRIGHGDYFPFNEIPSYSRDLYGMGAVIYELCTFNNALHYYPNIPPPLASITDPRSFLSFPSLILPFFLFYLL